jgi:type IV secretion system protein VirB6
MVAGILRGSKKNMTIYSVNFRSWFASLRAIEDPRGNPASGALDLCHPELDSGAKSAGSKILNQDQDDGDHSSFMRSIHTYIITFLLLFTTLVKPANASTTGDIGKQIVNILENLTCETQGVGDLLSSEFSHTCIPAPFFTFLVANLVSPGLYANTVLRLKINDDELFPNACGRNNRIDPNNPVLSFGICSNTKLIVARSVAVVNSVVAIAAAMLTGQDPWDAIKNSWNIPKIDYHNMYYNQAEGDEGNMFDVGVIPWIPWQVIKDNDKMCVATRTITFGWIPVGCKYIREPFPQSIYSDFMDLTSSGDTPPANAYDPMQLTKCGGAGGGCYQRAYNNSKTGIVISGPILECIKEMTARLLVSQNVCSFDDLGTVIGTVDRNSSTLFTFQKNMHRFVSALLMLYVVFYGFKIILSGNPPDRGEIFNFIFKIVFVTYFSIGISVGSGPDDRLDGMVQFVVPTLLAALEQLASWIMSASPSNLCVFNISDYPSGMGNLALWDALDCRVSHYLGLDILRTMMVENMARNHDFANFDFFSFAIPPYYFLLIPAVLSGNMTLVSLAMMYPLLVLSVAAYLVNSTVVCIIAIVILSVLAPLFVPMLLFNYTRGYFDAWVKLMISFVLQPMVVVTFLITMFSVYDFGFYGTCQYTSKEVSIDSTPNSRQAKVFFIDQQWGNYASDDDVKGCQNSLGYILNNPFAALYDMTQDTVAGMAGPPNTDTASYMAIFPFLSSITSSPSIFFTAPKMIYEKLKDLILALITACFTLYLMYHFSGQLSEFAADMTEGVSLSDVSIKPQAIFKAGMSAISAAGSAMKGSADTATKGRPGGSKDTATKGGGGSDDTSDTGGGSSDTASTGGGGGSSDTSSVSTGGSGVSSSSSSNLPSSSSSSSSFSASNAFSKISSPAPSPNIAGATVQVASKSSPAMDRLNKAKAPEMPKTGMKNTIEEINRKIREKAGLKSAKPGETSSSQGTPRRTTTIDDINRIERGQSQSTLKQNPPPEKELTESQKKYIEITTKRDLHKGHAHEENPELLKKIDEFTKEKGETTPSIEKHPGKEDSQVVPEYGVTKLRDAPRPKITQETKGPKGGKDDK